MRNGLSLILCLILAGTFAACEGGATEPAPTEGHTVPLSRQLRISSDAHAFDTSALRAPAEQDFELHYLNRSPVPHNVAIYSDASAQIVLHVGGIITDSEVVYQIPALPAGLYFFRCDVHPETMQGRLSVE